MHANLVTFDLSLVLQYTYTEASAPLVLSFACTVIVTFYLLFITAPSSACRQLQIVSERTRATIPSLSPGGTNQRVYLLPRIIVTELYTAII